MFEQNIESNHIVYKVTGYQPRLWPTLKFVFIILEVFLPSKTFFRFDEKILMKL